MVEVVGGVVGHSQSPHPAWERKLGIEVNDTTSYSPTRPKPSPVRPEVNGRLAADQLLADHVTDKARTS